MSQSKGQFFNRLSNSIKLPLSQVFLAEEEVIPDEPRIMEISTTFMMASTKFRRLKDLMWIRETLEDLTTAEFASSLDATQGEGQRKRKRAVDYDKLLGQLDKRLKDLGCSKFDIDCVSSAENDNPKPMPGRGMGTLVYSDEQRDALFSYVFMLHLVLSQPSQLTSTSSL